MRCQAATPISRPATTYARSNSRRKPKNQSAATTRTTIVRRRGTSRSFAHSRAAGPVGGCSTSAGTGSVWQPRYGRLECVEGGCHSGHGQGIGVLLALIAQDVVFGGGESRSDINQKSDGCGSPEGTSSGLRCPAGSPTRRGSGQAGSPSPPAGGQPPDQLRPPSAAVSSFACAARYRSTAAVTAATCEACLLYTSDAADDLTRVDLGGRR